MLTVGDHFPEYELTACVSPDPENAFETIDHKAYEGKWRVVFFWPKDYTFVCPTEIAEFSRLNGEFADRDAQVLGASVDSEYVHFAWRRDHPDLRDLPFPMLSDIKRELSAELGILGEDGVAQRATFIVDPSGVIQFVMVNSGSVGRNVEETLRVLDALQSNTLCGCRWNRGDEGLDAKKLMAAT
ncbi:alkyl hydroperoxide reductase [Planobispora rosea]|uniref:Alkyl hydroperoxide reductase C n=1 Tax=Planobispora rosea TaxID=35762 RepID=A0A8J3RWL0_PLARO|nr:peroxiredoxin [Planobispora rosea]GGS52917.1 alkyl hydroperoxide reductase [Planobispora rosea]GIH83122.1 alkyl hydroperoxide reductase [Planobispora rosea]